MCDGFLLRAFFGALVLVCLTGCDAAAGPVFGVPEGPEFSARGYQLILDFEVGGGAQYYDAFLGSPSWPGASSGVTVGVGYDCGYSSKAVIRSDWQAVREWERLARTSGVTGRAAKRLIPGLEDIVIAWRIAEEVFRDVTIARYWQATKRAFPGVESLREEAQWALLSLVFNRGTSMTGGSRAEMREIRAAVARGDYEAMARANRASVRVWAGTSVERGLTRRRNAEADLMEAK